MLHVFISHHNADEEPLDRFAKALAEAEIPYWYDATKESGVDWWHAKIDTALREAFALAVIVTGNSVDSVRTTYEWSWALGNSLPVYALLFEDVTASRFPAPLSMQHTVNCLNEIPPRFLQELKEHQQENPDTYYLDQLIVDLVMPFRVLARVALWLYPYAQQDIVSPDLFRILMEHVRDEARLLHYHVLPEIMIDKSYALTSERVRQCRALIKAIESFWEFSFNVPDDSPIEFADQTGRVTNVEDFRLNNLEPQIRPFDHTRIEYRALDAYLKSIDEHDSSNRWLMLGNIAREAVKYVGNEVDLIWEAIQAIAERQFSDEPG